MTYIEINHVILAIISCKRKYFNEQYVTYQEANIISGEIEKRFTKENINVIIESTKIDQEYFESKPVISLKKSWYKTEKRFQNITNLKVLNILFDESFILNLLLKISKDNIENIENKINSQKSQKNTKKELLTYPTKKNLLLEYKNKLQILKERDKKQNSWEEDLKFYLKVQEYYQFLTNDFYHILKKAISDINLSNINNPYLEFRYETENNQDLLKKEMFLNFIETYHLGTKKELLCAPSGTNIIKIYLTNIEDLLKSYYLELEKMEYLYYPEELGPVR